MFKICGLWYNGSNIEGVNMKDKVLLALAVVIIGIFVLYMGSTGTLTAYESELDANVSTDIAKWNITVNDQKITDAYEKTLALNDITWHANHADPTKIAPGGSGEFQLIIDPVDTEVAIRYDIVIEDHKVDDRYVLTITNLTVGGEPLIQTAPNTYTGIFTLNDIEQGKTKTLDIEVAWLDDAENDWHDSQIGMGEVEAEYLKLEVVAKQYLGEEIEEYVVNE